MLLLEKLRLCHAMSMPSQSIALIGIFAIVSLVPWCSAWSKHTPASVGNIVFILLYFALMFETLPLH
jgi:hypothetical protein